MTRGGTTATTSGSDGRILTVVVPTRDNERTLGPLLESLHGTEVLHEVIVVDNGSRDRTAEIARAAGARLLSFGPERSAQRNLGLRHVTTSAVVFLDSDMIAGDGLLDEVAALIGGGADAVILTEASVGRGFWAGVRELEKACYEGDDLIEAARAFRTAVVRALGGYDEALAAFEDWDLTARARAAGVRFTRTRSRVLHDEGHLTLGKAIAKKGYYGRWEERYRAKHPELAARQLSAWRRLRPFARNAGRLLRRPHLAAGLLVLKGIEYLASRRATASEE